MTTNIVTVKPDDIKLPPRLPDTHKGDYGRVLIIGGSVGYTGAAALSARAASRTGAGLVYAGVPKSIYEITAVKLNEEMPFPLPDEEGHLIAGASGEILRRAETCDVCLIGPGLGMADDIPDIVQAVICNAKIPVILDADALNAISKVLSQDTGILKNASCPLVLTPHPGEFTRLNGERLEAKARTPAAGEAASRTASERTEAATKARAAAASDFAQKNNCILVLKGHRTITALPDGACFENTTGGPALAKGGTGDVLAGMIAAFTAQKFPIHEAVKNAVCIHGLAGDICAEKYGEYSVTAGDVIEKIPKAMMKVTKGTAYDRK